MRTSGVERCAAALALADAGSPREHRGGPGDCPSLARGEEGAATAFLVNGLATRTTALTAYRTPA